MLISGLSAPTDGASSGTNPHDASAYTGSTARAGTDGISRTEVGWRGSGSRVVSAVMSAARTASIATSSTNAWPGSDPDRNNVPSALAPSTSEICCVVDSTPLPMPADSTGTSDRITPNIGLASNPCARPTSTNDGASVHADTCGQVNPAVTATAVRPTTCSAPPTVMMRLP